MSKPILIVLIVAVSLILVGVLIGMAGLWMRGFRVSGLFGGTVVTVEHTELAEFRSICVEDAQCDVRLAVSEDNSRRVVCREQERVPYTVASENGTLTIRRNDQRKWYHHIGIFWDKTEITVYLPKGEYDSFTLTGSTCDVELPKELSFGTVDMTVSTGDVRCFADVRESFSAETSTGAVEAEGMTLGSVRVRTDTGSVSLRSVRATGEVQIKVDTGRIKLDEVRCGLLTTESSTGRQTLTGVIAEGQMRLTSSTGDITLTGCDAASLEIEASTGDVSATLLSEKIFIARASTGKIRVPDGTSGGICRITTSTGDIEAHVQK